MSELMSAMQLTTFPIVALVLFLLAFAAVLARIFRAGSRAEMDRHATLPLDEPIPPTSTQHTRSH
ncbi:MAG: cbb3-type cytochrome c oxidase subunit 3 [Phycisphaeraceae bacterium]|nr:cbb3-type cytochrome c oxidase subunit 3 [Phycisphaeraceae bacterium]